MACRYVVSTAIIGFVYTLIQIPFAIYYASKEKRFIKHQCLPEFDFYGDKVLKYFKNIICIKCVYIYILDQKLAVASIK